MCTVAQALSTVPLLRTELSPKYWFTSTRDQVHRRRRTHPNYTAGGLVASGGAFGYYKAGSIPSLLGGLLGGAAFVGAGYIIQKGDDFNGHALGAAAGWGLTLGMGSRGLRSGKFMPAGAAATIGLVAALYNSKKASDWM